MARGLGVETKETLGETRKTIWVFGKPQSMWIPMMNPNLICNCLIKKINPYFA